MAFRTNKMPVLQEKSASGAVATFNTALAMPLVECKVSFSATQSGSGTPSPSNPRSISGWSKIRIGQLGNSPLNSYFEGLYNGTYGFADLGSLTWYLNAAGQFYTAQTNPTGEQDLTGSNLICSDKYTGGNAYTGDTDKTICIVGESLGRIWVKDSDYSDVTSFKNSLSGVYLIYELKTPTTPTITDTQFDTLLTAFGVSGSMFTIQIGSTVYGGYYDARTGVLTVTHKLAIFDGNENWTKSLVVSGAYFIENWVEENSISNSRDHLQNLGKTVNYTQFTQLINTCYFGQTLQFRVDNSLYPTVDDFKNFLSQNNLQLLYPLPTPKVINLGGMEIDTLQGVNNIWADTGDVDLTYKDLDIAKRGNFREVFKLPS